MNTGQIYYAVAEDRGFLKLEGILRYPLSKRLSQAVSQIFSAVALRGVVVDLQRAEFIDSTCLGLLARLATRCLELACERPIIVCSQQEINRQLQAMGFDKVFVLIDNPAAPAQSLADAESLAGLTPRPDPVVVLDAHRALCEINQNNRQLFQNVIDQLEPAVAANPPR
jgi:anti-anti-sigma factor